MSKHKTFSEEIDTYLANKTNDTKAKKIINKFCKEETSRQRAYLYDYLDEKLDIKIDRQVYNYNNKTIDDARFECTNEIEVNLVIERIVRELNQK